MKERILQKIADHIIKMIKTAPTDKAIKFWYNIGMNFNLFCVNQDIYLK